MESFLGFLITIAIGYFVWKYYKSKPKVSKSEKQAEKLAKQQMAATIKAEKAELKRQKKDKYPGYDALYKTFVETVVFLYHPEKKEFYIKYKGKETNISVSDIYEVELRVNSKVVAKGGVTGSVVGGVAGALFGGALFGAAGVVAGAVSNKKQLSKIKNVDLILTTNDYKNPTIKMRFETGGSEVLINQVDELLKSIEIILRQNK